MAKNKLTTLYSIEFGELYNNYGNLEKQDINTLCFIEKDLFAMELAQKIITLSQNSSGYGFYIETYEDKVELDKEDYELLKHYTIKGTPPRERKIKDIIIINEKGLKFIRK